MGSYIIIPPFLPMFIRQISLHLHSVIARYPVSVISMSMKCSCVYPLLYYCSVAGTRSEDHIERAFYNKLYNSLQKY